MRTLKGLSVAAACFLASFALHIVGGATDQGWLFAFAVALIFATAAGFPAIAVAAAGARRPREVPLTLVAGSIVAVSLTAAALWAANDRALAWWTLPAAAALVALATAAGFAAQSWRP